MRLLVKRIDWSLPGTTRRASLLLLACMTLTVLSARPVQAAIWEDLSVNVDAEWAGCGNGGYFPIRISLSNRGPARSVKFVYEGDGCPTVSRSVEIASPGSAPGAIQAQVTLLVPCVSEHSYPVLRVYVNGRLIPDLTEHSVGGPEPRSPNEYGPAILVIANCGARLGSRWHPLARAAGLRQGIMPRYVQKRCRRNGRPIRVWILS